MLEDGFNFFKSVLFSRGHNPKLGVRGFVLAAKDGRIEKVHPAL